MQKLNKHLTVDLLCIVMSYSSHLIDQICYIQVVCESILVAFY